MADSLPPPSRPPKLVSFVCNNMRGMLWMHAPLSLRCRAGGVYTPSLLGIFQVVRIWASRLVDSNSKTSRDVLMSEHPD
jgi:hypothetical protein